jgi:hypothetical protein
VRGKRGIIKYYFVLVVDTQWGRIRPLCPRQILTSYKNAFQTSQYSCISDPCRSYTANIHREPGRKYKVIRRYRYCTESISDIPKIWSINSPERGLINGNVSTISSYCGVETLESDFMKKCCVAWISLTLMRGGCTSSSGVIPLF